MSSAPPLPPPVPRRRALEAIAAALARLQDDPSKDRIAFVVEEIVDAIVASAPRGRRELRLQVTGVAGKLAQEDVTVGFQKHPPR